MRDKRHWLVELLVIALLLGAFVTWKLDLLDRFGRADSVAAPIEVAPPNKAKLPVAASSRKLARAAQASPVDPGKVAATLAGLIDRSVLGPRVSILVTDRTTGATLFRQGSPRFTPASTLKLATTVASLQSLGPMTTFKTTVVRGQRPNEIILVGGGDPYLASTSKADQAAYPIGGNLADLAKRTAQAPGLAGSGPIKVRVDDSLFSGPSISADWRPNYVPDSVVSPINSLWVDQARVGFGFARDPALQAGQEFKAQLVRAGVQVEGPIRRSKAAPSAVELASVHSAPLGEIVEEVLGISDNQAAEVLARHVGLKVANDPSFRGGATAVQQVLAGAGVNTTGNVTFDGSGLSRANRLTADSLAQTLRLATAPGQPGLRASATGLPVAGFTGSLQWRFGAGPSDALGRVRAKTGTLTGVHGLAGLVTTSDNAQMIFVLVADRVAPDKGGLAQMQLDKIAGALGACTCGVGSRP